MIYLLDTNTGLSRKIIDDASIEEFAWSSDARRIAFRRRGSADWSVWVMLSS